MLFELARQALKNRYAHENGKNLKKPARFESHRRSEEEKGGGVLEVGPTAGAKGKSPPPQPPASLKGGKTPFAVVPVVVSAEKIQRLVTERVETLRADTLGKLDHAPLSGTGGRSSKSSLPLPSSSRGRSFRS